MINIYIKIYLKDSLISEIFLLLPWAKLKDPGIGATVANWDMIANGTPDMSIASLSEVLEQREAAS